MKKNILFVIPGYSHGGTNKCLEYLLDLIDKEKYNISIFSLYEDGDSYYKKLFQPYLIRKSFLYTLAHDHYITRKIWGVWIKLKKSANFSWLYKLESMKIEKYNHLDTVIAYQEGVSTEFVSYMKQVVKVAWVHCDLQRFRKGVVNNTEYNYYQKFDHIICVSRTSATSLSSFYPLLSNKISTIYNPLNEEKIRVLSKEKHQEQFPNIFKIISIGRLVPIKQYDKIPFIVKRLIAKGCQHKFVWYIIGEGSESEMLESTIKDLGLNEYIKLLGAKENPYPYIKDADLLVVTSKSESYPTVINEAKILQTPVISTKYPSVSEILSEKEGYICELENMPSILCRLINDEESSYTKIKNNLKDFELKNDKLVNKIYKVL